MLEREGKSERKRERNNRREKEKVCGREPLGKALIDTSLTLVPPVTEDFQF